MYYFHFFNLQTVAKIFLARLLKTFRFVLPEDYRLQLVWRTSLQPKGNLLYTVECIWQLKNWCT